MKKIIVIGAIVLVVVGLLWLGFSGGDSGGDNGVTDNKPPSESKWVGTMSVSTDNVLVVYDGRSVRCTANEVTTPSHFMVRVTNYADQSLTCDVVVRETNLLGSHTGDVSWLRLPAIPTVAPQKAGSIPIGVDLPANLPDGQYTLEIVVSKASQVFTCPVVFSVDREKKV